MSRLNFTITCTVGKVGILTEPASEGLGQHSGEDLGMQ